MGSQESARPRGRVSAGAVVRGASPGVGDGRRAPGAGRVGGGPAAAREGRGEAGSAGTRRPWQAA